MKNFLHQIYFIMVMNCMIINLILEAIKAYEDFIATKKGWIEV